MSRSNTPEIVGTDYRKTKRIKITVIGESGVGKSSLALRFVKGEFHENCPPTICAAFLTTKVQFDECQATLEIWDTAGQERFHCLTPMFYRDSKACVIVYDITRQESFNRAKSWVNEVQRHGDPNVVIVLAGNKLDLENTREVSREEAESYAESRGFIFLETSAKTCTYVNELFIELARKSVMVEENTEQSGNLESVNMEYSPHRYNMCFCK